MMVRICCMSAQPAIHLRDMTFGLHSTYSQIQSRDLPAVNCVILKEGCSRARVRRQRKKRIRVQDVEWQLET